MPSRPRPSPRQRAASALRRPRRDNPASHACVPTPVRAGARFLGNGRFRRPGSLSLHSGLLSARPARLLGDAGGQTSLRLLGLHSAAGPARRRWGSAPAPSGHGHALVRMPAASGQERGAAPARDALGREAPGGVHAAQKLPGSSALQTRAADKTKKKMGHLYDHLKKKFMTDQLKKLNRWRREALPIQRYLESIQKYRYELKPKPKPKPKPKKEVKILESAGNRERVVISE
ncbi:uncharacterized protein C5orf52 homolog isoform X1 [Petaurus breviceps papuanus]|uniref:uncharacterized protein C5orf52 homolog isoform X1 n=1 Tax=Petaurus breviceps papuanus TaxID=3040969 RepID=UPI0036DA3C31